MKYLFLSVFFAAQMADVVSAANPGKPDGVLHSKSNPKLKLYKGKETAGVNNWKAAHKFCKSKGRVLATRNEWCNANWKKWGPDDVFGGIKDGEQWAPVRGSHQNEWIQVGHLDGDPSNACKEYSEIYEVSDGTEGQEKKEKQVDTTVYCTKPAGCTGTKCPLPDVRKKGYYPDPTDCTARCYYSGTNAGNFWEKTTEEGKIWDPYCMNSDPLSRKNKPLAGMTGGCFNPKHYVDDTSYCTAGPAARHRQLKRKVWDKPEWGMDETRYNGSNNYILCALIPEAPEFPQTCASVYGDPHIVTYDGLKYDNQGNGDYILQQSLDSEMNIQGRFAHFSDMQASVTRAVTIDTGREDEPVVEVGFLRKCSLRYYVDGKEIKMDKKFVLKGDVRNWNLCGALHPETSRQIPLVSRIGY